MLLSDLYSEFKINIQDGDLQGANTSLMRELGNVLVSKRADFVHLLNESNIVANETMSDTKLVDLFISNIDKNNKLALGAALLVNVNNKQVGFDGDDEISDSGVKAAYVTMRDYFSAANGASEEFYNFSFGGSSKGEAGLWDVVKSAVDVSGDITKKKMGQKTFGTDLLNKKQDAKTAITQQILANRQTELETAQKAKESKAKTIKTILIIGGAVIGLSIIGLVIYKIKKR